MQCWVWQGAKDKGYGKVRVGSKILGVHRVAYEAIIGPIPVGLEIDHLCRNHGCYNPEHLEPVTHKENLRRGNTHGKETHCPQGHSYSGSNLMTGRQKRHSIYRRCKICHATQQRAYTARRKANAV